MAISSSSSLTATIATNHVLCYRYPSSSSSSMVSFNLSRNPKLQFFNKGSPPRRNLLAIVKAEPNEASLIEWSLIGDLFSSLLCYFWDKVLRPAFASKVALVCDDSSATNNTKLEVATMSIEDTNPSSNEQQPSSQVLATQDESMSQFITQVATLVKLVDSRDIVELKLKHFDCEVTIRKKEAIHLQPQAHAEVAIIHSFQHLHHQLWHL